MKALYINSVSNEIHSVKAKSKKVRKLEKATVAIAEMKVTEELKRAKEVAAEFGNDFTPEMERKVQKRVFAFCLSEITPTEIYKYLDDGLRARASSMNRTYRRASHIPHICARGHRPMVMRKSNDDEESSDGDSSDSDSEHPFTITAIRITILKDMRPRLSIPLL